MCKPVYAIDTPAGRIGIFEGDESNYVSADTYGYYVGLCREVLGRDGKYRKSLRVH